MWHVGYYGMTSQNSNYICNAQGVGESPGINYVSWNRKVQHIVASTSYSGTSGELIEPSSFKPLNILMVYEFANACYFWLCRGVSKLKYEAYFLLHIGVEIQYKTIIFRSMHLCIFQLQWNSPYTKRYNRSKTISAYHTK